MPRPHRASPLTYPAGARQYDPGVFDITTSTTGFAFKIYPPPGAPRDPFTVELVKRNLPKNAEVELVVDQAIERLLVARADGLERIADPLLDARAKPLGPAYYDALRKDPAQQSMSGATRASAGISPR